MFQITPRCMKYMNYLYMKYQYEMHEMHEMHELHERKEMLLSSHESTLKPLKSLRRICQSRKAGASACCASDEAHPSVCSFLNDGRLVLFDWHALQVFSTKPMLELLGLCHVEVWYTSAVHS